MSTTTEKPLRLQMRLGKNMIGDRKVERLPDSSSLKHMRLGPNMTTPSPTKKEDMDYSIRELRKALNDYPKLLDQLIAAERERGDDERKSAYLIFLDVERDKPDTREDVVSALVEDLARIEERAAAVAAAATDDN